MIYIILKYKNKMCDRFIKCYKNPFLYHQNKEQISKTTKTQWLYLSSLVRNSSKILSNDHLPKQYFNYDKLKEEISHMVVLWYIKYNSRVKSYGLKMIGFILAIEEEETDSITIDAICSHYKKRSGTLLMTWFIRYCKNQYCKIELYSLLSTLNYYRKFGFIHSFSKKETEDKEISDLYCIIKDTIYHDEKTCYNILKYEKILQYNYFDSFYYQSIKHYFELEYVFDEPIFDTLELDEKNFNQESIKTGRNGLYDLIKCLIKHKFIKDICTERQLFMTDYDYTADGFYMVLYL